MDEQDRTVLKLNAGFLPPKFYQWLAGQLGNDWYDIAVNLEVLETSELDMLRATYPPQVPANALMLNSKVLTAFQDVGTKILQDLHDALGKKHGRLRQELLLKAKEKYFGGMKEPSKKQTVVTDGTDGTKVVLPGVPDDAETETNSATEPPVAKGNAVNQPSPIRNQPAATTPVTGESQPAASIPSATQPAIATQASGTTQPASPPVATVTPMETEEQTTDGSNPSRPALYQLTSQEDIEDLL